MCLKICFIRYLPTYYTICSQLPFHIASISKHPINTLSSPLLILDFPRYKKFNKYLLDGISSNKLLSLEFLIRRQLMFLFMHNKEALSPNKVNSWMHTTFSLVLPQFPVCKPPLTDSDTKLTTLCQNI